MLQTFGCKIMGAFSIYGDRGYAANSTIGLTLIDAMKDLIS